MALPIRPAIQPMPPVAPRADAGRLAAQKAFFQAALAKPDAVAAPAAQAAPTPVQAPSQPVAQTAARAATPPDDAPTKILRPGSLLDIRV